MHGLNTGIILRFRIILRNDSVQNARNHFRTIVHSRNKTIRKFAVELLTARTPETPDLKPALDSALTFHDSGFSVSVAKISTAKRAGRDGTGSFNEKAVVLAHKRIVCYTPIFDSERG